MKRDGCFGRCAPRLPSGDRDLIGRAPTRGAEKESSDREGISRDCNDHDPPERALREPRPFGAHASSSDAKAKRPIAGLGGDV
jgi:hypothetical protein